MKTKSIFKLFAVVFLMFLQVNLPLLGSEGQSFTEEILSGLSRKNNAGKIYLKEEVVEVSADGIYLHAEDYLIKIPSLYSDSEGVYILEQDLNLYELYQPSTYGWACCHCVKSGRGEVRNRGTSPSCYVCGHDVCSECLWFG